MTQFFRVIRARAYGTPNGAIAVKVGDIMAITDARFAAFADCMIFDHDDGVILDGKEERKEVLAEEAEHAKPEEPEVFEVSKEAIVKKTRKKRVKENDI